MKRARRGLGALLILGLGLAGLGLTGLWLTEQRAARLPLAPSISGRLLGPIAELAAGWQWVRVRLAQDAGRRDLAHARAEFALELDPAATGGWAFLASILAFDRASIDREPDPRLRQLWTAAALELLQRGERVARRPAQLALQRGIILVHVCDGEGAIPWPGGTGGAWREAQAAFERATDLDPGSSEGWAQLASNLCWGLGSPALGPDAALRQASQRESLATLERGLGVSREQGALQFQRGMLLEFIAEGPDGAQWPGGLEELLVQAIEAFRLAREAQFALAPAALEGARQTLQAWRKR